MKSVWRFLVGRSVGTRLLFGSLLLLGLIVTRWCWIDCDGGTPSLNEYGYFATDEGYYTGGGRQKFLYGQFINVIRAAPNTFAICPALHVMTWGGFSIFGQTTWAHRFFPLLACTLAWLLAFLFLSRKTPAWIAFLLCGCCLFNPLLTVYSRTACNDTLMASVLLIGYAVARRKGFFAPFAGGCLFGLGVWVKQSIWVLFPLGVSAALTAYTTEERLRRALYFLLGFIVSALTQWALIRFLIYEDALSQGVSIQQLLAISNSSYPLPNVFDWLTTLKAVSAFPRFPTDGLLGVWVVLFTVLPALLLLRRLTERPVRWNGSLLLYATLPLYAAAIMILPVYYAHYFIPVIVFTPVLWLEARRDLKLWGGEGQGFALALMTVCLVFIVTDFRFFFVAPEQAMGLADFLANAYNLPQKIMWEKNGLFIVKAALLLALMGLLARHRKPTMMATVGVLVSAFGVAELCYALLPLAEAYKFTNVFSDTMKHSALIIQTASIILFFSVWGLPQVVRKGVRWHLLLAALLVFATVVNPVWRKGVRELTERRHLHKQAVADLARLVPANAVVYGERAPQLFLTHKARVSAVANGNPVPLILNMRRQHPTRPLFALIDSEHNYHFKHYEETKGKIQLRLLHTLQLPSFNTGTPVNTYLVQLVVNEPPAKR